VVSLVLDRLDCGNTTLLSLSPQLQRQLQSLLNASARLIFGAGKYEHVTALMRSLHWQRFPERIIHKVATLTIQCLHVTTPEYLSVDLRPVVDARLAVV
jgi:hypothetical protein